jgi:hypothetical protein
MRPNVRDEQIADFVRGDLMPRHRRGNHEHLAVVELVSTPVFGHPLQIGVRHPRLNRLHGSHLTIANPFKIHAWWASRTAVVLR